MLLTERQRTTPFGLWRYAKEFAEAGHAAKGIYPTRTFTPAYYLMGHSIELSFKAFLLGRGVSLAELKGRAMGHDLDALFKRARLHQLGREVVLSSTDGGVIRLLNQEYMTKRFEYIRAGAMTIPDWGQLASATDKLVGGLKGYCERASIAYR